MDKCPCCEDQLLRQIRSGELRWFCRSCWQEMPFISPSAKPRIVASPPSISNTLVSTQHLGQRHALVTPA